MNKPVIECVRDYVMQFPELKDGCLLVDFLGSQPVEYVVETVPCDPVYKRYIDGSCVRQFLFLFASREYYSEDVNKCIENNLFYEKFADWIEGNNYDGLLPELDDRYSAVSIEVVTGGYAFDEGTNTARYQMQLRLIYEEV